MTAAQSPFDSLNEEITTTLHLPEYPVQPLRLSHDYCIATGLVQCWMTEDGITHFRCPCTPPSDYHLQQQFAEGIHPLPLYMLHQK